MKINKYIIFIFCLLSSLIEASNKIAPGMPGTYANCQIPAGTYTGYWDDHINRELGEDAKNIISKLVIPPYDECSRLFFFAIPYEILSVASWSVSLIDKDGIERQYDLIKSVRFMCHYNEIYIIKDYLIDYEALTEWYTGVRIAAGDHRRMRGTIMNWSYWNRQLVISSRDASIFLRQNSFFSPCSSIVLDLSLGMAIFNHDN